MDSCDAYVRISDSVLLSGRMKLYEATVTEFMFVNNSYSLLY